jgi:lipopolysaccharide/colanic/teichoic acid biosynthesis glycosyltransferase
MTHQCEKWSGPQWSTIGDPRVTPVGMFLRATHLDELPQLWNVLRGEMSLVGPRPERPEFVPYLECAIPYYRQRLCVRPGVTGLAQVQLPADSDLKSVQRKLMYDLYYVQHMCLWLDVRIVVCTLLKVCGVRFPILRKLFRMPTGTMVKLAYKKLSAGGKSPGPSNKTKSVLP